MCNLNSFSSFEQYSFPASFWKKFEKKCATHDTVQLTTLVFPPISPTLLILVRHSRHPCQLINHLIHAGTLPTSPTLACHSRYHTKHITYVSMPPSLVNLPDSLPTKFITNLKIYMKRNFDTQQYKILYFKDDFFRHC